MEKEHRANLIAGINMVIADPEQEFDLNFVPPKMVDDYMKSLGYKRLDFDTNGWDYDWWLTYEKDKKKFMAYGCGWTGSFSFEAHQD